MRFLRFGSIGSPPRGPLSAGRPGAARISPAASGSAPPARSRVGRTLRRGLGLGSALVLGAALVALPGCGAKKGNGGAQAQGSAAAKNPQAAKAAKGPQGRMGPGGAPPAGPAIPVAVEPAVRGPIASYYSTTATLEPNKEADILARVSGVVTSIKAEEGDAVRKGDDVLVIQDDEYRYRLAQAEAEVDKQQTKFNRLQKMFAGNLVSADEFDTARTDFEAAKAARDLAKLELSYTRVVSPFRGRVTRRLVDPGQTVSNGTPLFSIADMSRLLAKVHVPSREFGKIQSDQPVELTLDSDRKKLQGQISLVSPVIEPSTGTIKVTVAIPDYPQGTRPGDFAEVRVVTERHPDAVLVDKVAVVTDRSEQVVFVAADTTAERRVVEVGFTDDEHAEILSGVEPGERVVVQGQRSLKHGSPLKIMDKIKYDAPEEATASGAGS